MGLLPIPAPRLTQGASRAGVWRAAALYDKRISRGLSTLSLQCVSMNYHWECPMTPKKDACEQSFAYTFQEAHGVLDGVLLVDVLSIGALLKCVASRGTTGPKELRLPLDAHFRIPRGLLVDVPALKKHPLRL